MSKVIKAFTGSEFVSREVFANLPRQVPLVFSASFNENRDVIIGISSPKYKGLISEARTMDEAYENAHDAILTYFDVPRECAKAIKFKVIEEKQKSPTILLQKIAIKQKEHA